MSLLALALVLVGACAHATWNLLAKRAGGGPSFVWLFGAFAAAIYAPLAVGVILLQRPVIGPPQLICMVGSGLIHLAYFLLLQQGYRVGDLSLVYPTARGTGPMLSTLAAVLVFGERPSGVALAGALVIGLSIVALTTGSGVKRGPGARQGVAFGLLTGVFIATYTLWDKQAVSLFLVPPLLQDWATSLSRSIVLLPVALRRWGEVRMEWRTHRAEVLGVAILCPLSYILVLTALTFTPVSYVAPAREISILVGTVMGARLLSEGNARRRLLAAAGMVVGVIALAVG